MQSQPIAWRISSCGRAPSDPHPPSLPCADGGPFVTFAARSWQTMPARGFIQLDCVENIAVEYA